VLKVYSSQGKFVAQAYFNPRASSIVGRVVSYREDVGPLDAIAQNIDAAIALRRLKGFGADPTARASSSSSAAAEEGRGSEPGSEADGAVGRARTDAYRVLNSEGDFVPGLIVDRYRDTLVVQISTLGMQRMKPHVLRMLEDRLQPRHIYEKSLGLARKVEGLQDECGWLRGGTEHVNGRVTSIEDVEVLEDGICYSVPIVHGQKTGRPQLFALRLLQVS